MKKIIFLAAILLLPICSSAKENESPYYKDFIKFLQVSGAEKTQKIAVQGMFEQFKKSPKMKSGAFDKIEELIVKELSKLNELLFPIYKKHLSHDDLKAIIAFYESDAGKRLVASQPEIVQESMQVGAQWGQDVAKRVLANPAE